MAGEISYLNALSENSYPKLSLCKPDRTTVSMLKDIYGLNLVIRETALNEINFTIPTKILIRHELVENPLVELIRDRYQIKMEFEGQTEYFLVLDKNKQLSRDGTTISYFALSLGTELADKDLRAYLEESKSLTEHANSMLSETIWRLDYVDNKFILKRRTLDIPSSTVLGGVLELATKFNAFIKFNTINRTISFYAPENIGINRGLKYKEGFNLESLNVNTNSNEQKTRLIVKGHDGLEFRSLSPTGSNYIEDFSYYMYPFEADENYNVIKHSDYMSDGLCIAILKYKEKLRTSQGIFEGLVLSRKNKVEEIQNNEEILSRLNTELVVINDELWVINRQYQSEAPDRDDWKDATARKEAKELEIANQEALLVQLRLQLTNILNSITQLGQELKTENNFTEAQLIELNTYIIVGEYDNDTIVDEQDLLDEAREVFMYLSQPPISVTINIEGYLESIRDRLKPARISVSDVITAESEELHVNLKLRTTEINVDFDNVNVDITIANGRDVIDENSKLKNVIYDSANTSTTVNIERHIYKSGGTALDKVNQILNSAYDTAKNVLLGGYESTTTIDYRGLFSQDYEDANTYLVVNNAILAITPDNGNSVSVAISKRGVHAEVLAGRMVLSNRLYIADELGVVNIENGLVSVSDTSENVRVELGRYVDPRDINSFKYGLKVTDGAIDILTGSTTTEGVVITSTGISGYNSDGNKTFELNSQTGKSSIKEDFAIETSEESLKGVKFDNNGLRLYNPTTGALTINLDAISGNATFQGTINASTINGGTINAGTINGGLINGTTISSANINISENIKVGNTIQLGEFLSPTTKFIRFNNTANISSVNESISISAETLLIQDGNVLIGNNASYTIFLGTVDFSNANVIGLP